MDVDTRILNHMLTRKTGPVDIYLVSSQDESDSDGEGDTGWCVWMRVVY